MLNWLTMPEDQFNRTAEALIRQSLMDDDPGLDVTVVDGRGGDGGIDIDARVKRTGELVAIYQLKFFPEGFSGGWAKARKPQITKSFEVALQHDPSVWYLVTPRNLTPKERSFVTALRRARSRPAVRHIGRTELDILLARYPAIEGWAERTPVRTALQIVGRETAALNEPGDLHAEVMNLADRARARSEYWAVDFYKDGDQYGENIVAVRPDAAQREPLSLTLTANFTDNPELGEAFKHTLEYGATEPLVLPESVVSSLRKNGPPWFAQELGSGTVALHPQPQTLHVIATVTLYGNDDRVLANRKAAEVQIVNGALGGQLIVDLGDSLVLTFVVPKEGSEGQVGLSATLPGLSGHAAKRVLRFLTALARATRIKVLTDDHPIEANLGAGRDEPPIVNVELADDLAVIEDELNVTLPYPDVIPDPGDRLLIRVVRHLLEGKISLMPGADGMSLVLEGETNPGLEELLSGETAVRQSAEVWSPSLLGQQLDIDDVTILMPKAIAVDGDAHLAALKAGQGAGRTVELTTPDRKSGILIWSPHRAGDNTELSPTPWGVTGISEHPQLQ